MFDTGSYFSLEGQTAISDRRHHRTGACNHQVHGGAGAKVAVLSYESPEQGRKP